MEIKRLIKITSGKLHGWFETDQGFSVRKPLGKVAINTAGTTPENMKQYSFKKGLIKGLNYFAIFALPVIIDKFIISFPEIAQLSVGAAIVMVYNFIKIKYYRGNN